MKGVSALRRFLGHLPCRGWTGSVRRLRGAGAIYDRRVALEARAAASRRALLTSQLHCFEDLPIIALAMPVHDPPERWLRAALDSVLAQIYPRWELVIADDASRSDAVRALLREYAARDDRIRAVFLTENGHISRATNAALELVTAPFVGFLDHDDELDPEALAEVVLRLRGSHADLVYTDEDKIDEAGHRFHPHFKTEWNPTMTLQLNWVTHFAVYRTELVRRLGGLRAGLEGAQDWDLLLRAEEHLTPEQVIHIPRVLYHWRATAGSTAAGLGNKPYAFQAGLRAAGEALVRRGISARVEHVPGRYYRVVPTGDPSTVSLIGARCPEAHCLEQISVRGWSAADLNAAAEQARGESLLFLRPGLRGGNPGWEAMIAGWLTLPGVGIVGARLVTSAGRTRECGLLVERRGGQLSLRRAFAGLGGDLIGYMGRDRLAQEWTAVSGDALLISRSLFHSLGGFDVGRFPKALFAVDLCLRAAEQGLRTIGAPEPAFVTHDLWPARQVPFPAGEGELLLERWGERIGEGDAFSNPALDRGATDFSIAFPSVTAISNPGRPRQRSSDREH